MYIFHKTLLDTINYKCGYKILSMLQHKNHNNMIIYGISKIGKTTVITQVLNEFFKKKIEIQPYESFINDRTIKVKNNKRYNRDSSIYICLNNLKEYQGKYKLQIFTI